MAVIKRTVDNGTGTDYDILVDSQTINTNLGDLQLIELYVGTAAIGGDATNGLDVDVTRVPKISAVQSDVALASTAASQQVLAANSSRSGLLLTNTDANAVYVYYGTTATATKFTVIIPSGGYWEMPAPCYTGRIDAIWAADGAGSLIGSEL